MKSKVIKFGSTLALASSLSGAFLVVPTVLMASPVHADDVVQTAVPDTVNISIHKLMYDKGKTITGLDNDGHEKSSTSGLAAWDKSQYGNVGFTLYDITAVVGSITNLTETKINAIIADVDKNGANSTYIKNAASNPTSKNVDADGIVTFANMNSGKKNSEYKIYLAVETTTPKGFVTQKAKPMVITAPMTTKDGKSYLKNIHVYPKNEKQKLSIQLKKKSKEIEKSTAENLKGAQFQLYKGEVGKGTKVASPLTTNDLGNVLADNLTVNNYYFVELPSKVADYADKVVEGDGKYIISPNAMNDTNNKLSFNITADGLSTVNEGSNIVVTSVDSSLTNYERPRITKELKNGTDIKAGTVDKDGDFSFDVGEETHHELAVTVPEDIAGGQNAVSINGTKYSTLPYDKFVVEDRPVIGDLIYIPSKADLVVSTGANGTGTKFVLGQDYLLEDKKDASGKFIGFDVVFVNSSKTASTLLKAQAGKKLYINYDVTVDKTANVSVPLVNKVTLNFSVGGHQGQIKDEDKLFTYGARIKKVSSGVFGSGVGGKALQGAEFVIKNAKGEFYSVADKNIVWVKAESQATKLTTDKEGLIILSGVKEGTYKLKETKAPTGYNKLAEEVELVVNKKTSGTQTGDLDPLVIKNDLKYEFHTGSRSILITTGLAGLTILVGAGAYVYRKKKANV